MPNTTFTSVFIKGHFHLPACNLLDGSFLQAHALKGEPLRMAPLLASSAGDGAQQGST